MVFKRSFLGVLVIAALHAPMNAIAAEEVRALDRIVAIVNNEAITHHELMRLVKTAQDNLTRQGVPLPPPEALSKQVLERLVVDRVQLQYAKETGIRVEDNTLDQALERIAAQNKLSLAEFRTTLGKEGIPFERFREEIREEMTLARLREREVDNKVVITDTEVDNLIATQRNTGMQQSYHLAHILVPVPDNASPETLAQRLKIAQEALQQLQAGKPFAQVAAQYSQAPDALKGGDLGWRQAGMLPELFLEAVRGLSAGQVSPILRSPNGFHLLRVVEKRGQDTPTLVPQTRVRHILIKVNEAVSDSDAKHRLLQLRERLVHGQAKFEELARLHSEDASNGRGGELGWINPGDTVPEFEKAMNALALMAISEPVKSPFGWHLLQVLERRTHDMSGEREKLQARQLLRQKKSDEQYQEWVRQQRDQAYVEYRLDE